MAARQPQEGQYGSWMLPLAATALLNAAPPAAPHLWLQVIQLSPALAFACALHFCLVILACLHLLTVVSTPSITSAFFQTSHASRRCIKHYCSKSCLGNSQVTSMHWPFVFKNSLPASSLLKHLASWLRAPMLPSWCPATAPAHEGGRGKGGGTLAVCSTGWRMLVLVHVTPLWHDCCSKVEQIITCLHAWLLLSCFRD